MTGSSFCFSQELLSQLRRLLHEPHLYFLLDKRFGADKAHHRQRIYDEVPPQVKDRSGSFSISHARGLGGLAWVENSNAQIGFDVEVRSRVTRDLVKRVALQSEIEAVSSVDRLWVAKESAFKALRGPAQPKTISKLNIICLDRFAEDNLPPLEMFKLNNYELKGVTFCREEFVFAVSLFLPLFFVKVDR